MEILSWIPKMKSLSTTYFDALVEEVNMTTELLLANLTKLTPKPIENLNTFVPVLDKPSL